MNVDSPEFLADPYRFYREKLDLPPLQKVHDHVWSSTRYHVISKVLAHPQAGRGNIGHNPQAGDNSPEVQRMVAENPAMALIRRWMLFNNPPMHTAMRKAVLDVFTTRMVLRLEPMVRDTIRELVDAVKEHGRTEYDMVAEIASKYPVSVICKMLGIPKSDQQRFQTWTNAFSYAVQADFNIISDSVKAHMNRAARELDAYFSELIPIKVERGDDDLMTRLISTGDQGLSHDELVANCVLFLFAGQETTTSTLCNGLNALLEHPDQYVQLVDNPGLIPNAIEECLRWDPAVQMVSRVALDDFETLDYRITKGDHFFLFIGAAGRDPEINPEPETFDIHREKIKHLNFARGAHHCIGTVLARLELKVAFEEIIRAFPGLVRAGEGQRNPTWLMRGFHSLPVRVG